MLKDLVKKCRSYRRFFQEVSIPYEDLKDMVDTARLPGCTKNCQGLKFKLISTPEECAKVFPSLLWAGALKDWDGPADGERPSAYVLVLEDLSIGKNLMWDEGIVSQTIMLSAVEKPKEEVRMVPVGEDGSTTYYRDENQVHYVPKRALEDILV